MNNLYLAVIVIVFLSIKLCNAQSNTNLIQPEDSLIITRIKVPEGYKRVEAKPSSFAYYLQHLLLKPNKTPVKLFNGNTKRNNVYVAVIDIPVGTKNLQQCADAIIRLRSEYLYKLKAYDKIQFNYTNGFNADYRKWRNGMRIKVTGNKCEWYTSNKESKTYKSFEEYLENVFIYAGTLSLSKQLISKPINEMQIGDVLIQGGSPGHAVIVVDMAVETNTGNKLFLLAQSYMPAQDIHLLINPNNSNISPWYSLNFNFYLNTPEWRFTKNNLMHFSEN